MPISKREDQAMEAIKRTEGLQGESVELLREILQELKALRTAIEEASPERGHG